MKNLLDYFNIKQATLVGHSIGGQIATDFALAYPNRVSKLVLIAPGLSGSQPSPDVEEWVERVSSSAPDAEKMTQLAVLSPCPQCCDVELTARVGNSNDQAQH